MSQPRSATRSLGWLLLLGALTGIGPVSIDLYLPAFSQINAELGSGIANTLAAYMFGVALGQLFYGPLSDRFGRKPPLYAALLLYIAGSLGCAMAGSMPALVEWRFVQALGGCAGVVIARAVVRDCCEPQEAARVFSTLILITAIGPIIAPLAGSFITAVTSWRVLFYGQAALGALLLIAMHFVLRETLVTPQSINVRAVGQTYLSLLRDRSFMAPALVGACAIGIVFCYISGAPTALLHTYSLSTLQLAWLMSCSGLAFVIASQFNRQQLRRHSPVRIMRVAVAVTVLLACITAATNLTVVSELPLLVLLQLGIFAGIGHIAPNATAEALSQQGGRAGVASALLGSLQSVGSTVAGAMFGLFNQGSVHVMAFLMLAFALAMWLAQRRVQHAH